MKNVPCEVPDIIGKKVVGVSKTITNGAEVEKILILFNDGSKLIIGKEDGFSAGAEWVSRASVKYCGITIENLLF